MSQTTKDYVNERIDEMIIIARCNGGELRSKALTVISELATVLDKLHAEENHTN